MTPDLAPPPRGRRPQHISPDHRLRRSSATAIAITLVLGACAAPFSEMQSARLAGVGVVEVTPSYSYVDVVGEGETIKIQDNYGLHISFGVHEEADMRLRIDHIRVTDEFDEDFVATAIGFGPKVAVIPDRLAAYLPIGFATGSGINVSKSWEFHPSVIGTLPIAENLDVTAAVKILVPLTRNEFEEGGGNDNFVAVNFGLGYGPDMSRWVIRPELGFMKNPGEKGTVRHFSIGFTYFYRKDRR